jgi:small subunit ribosomal protein S2
MNNLIKKQLISLSAHIGHDKSRWNPQMENYIFGHINNIHILNIDQAVNFLQKIKGFLINVIKKKGKILIITDKDYNMKSNKYIQYISSSQLLNGSLTNFMTFKNNHKKLQINNNKKNNIKYFISIPDVIFIFNINNKDSFIDEAISLNIPIISLIDNNNNPNKITYPIPSNNEYNQVILFYIDYIQKIFNEAIIDSFISFNQEYNLFKNIKIK